MSCHRPTQCDACKKFFSSLCTLHSHLIKGVNKPGYLYSVYLSENGLLLAQPAGSTCSDVQTSTCKSTELAEQNVKQSKELSEYPKKDICTEIKEEESMSTKPFEQRVKIKGKQVNITCADIQGAENRFTKPPEQSLDHSVKIIGKQVNIACGDIHGEENVSVKPPEDNVDHSMKVIEKQVNIAHGDIQGDENRLTKLSEQSLDHSVKIIGKQVNRAHADIHKRQSEAVKFPQQSLEQARKVIESPVKNACTDKQKGRRKSCQMQKLAKPQKPVAILPKTMLEKSTAKNNAHGSQVMIFRIGCSSNNVKSNEIAVNDIAGSNAKQVQKETQTSSPNYLNISLPSIMLDGIQQVDLGRHDSSSAKQKSDARVGKQSMFCPSSAGVVSLPTSSVTVNWTDSCVPECSKDSSEAITDSENKKLETVPNENTQYNVTPVLLIGNKHCRKEKNGYVELENIYMKELEDIKEDSVNIYDDRFDELVSVSQVDNNGNQELGTSYSRQCYDLYMHDRGHREGDNISHKLDIAETDVIQDEHNYSKKLNSHGVQFNQMQDEWQVVYNKEYNEGENQNSDSDRTESINSELENQHFNTNTGKIVEGNYAVEHVSQRHSSSDFIKTGANENNIKTVEELATKDGKDCKLKSTNENRDRKKEVELYVPRISKESFVFYQYGFKLIQGQKLYVQCQFCLKKFIKGAIAGHSQKIHHKQPEYNSKFRHRLNLLLRFMKRNCSPGSRVVKIKISQEKKYKFCGFSIQPFPELKLMCNACKHFFFRNDFIRHVSDCYECHEINITQEFSDQLELLKKTAPVFEKRKKVVKEKQKVQKDAKVTSNRETTKIESTRTLFRQFRDINPELFKTNMPEFLKEFQEYEKRKQDEMLEDNRKKQENLVKCTVCSKQIKASYLKAHVKNYHTSQSYPCEVCGGIYPSTYSLYNHQRYVHGEKGKFPCSVCGKEYTTRVSFSCHLSSVHRSKKQVQCPVCKKKFRNQHLLDRHELVHKGSRPFSCHACDATFKRADHLKVHIDKVHDLTVLWVCSVPGCEARYRYKVQLDSHIQRHTDKRFSCSNCPRQFTGLSLLNRHREKRHSLKEKLKIEDFVTGQTDAKEMDCGFDGLTQLKTLVISGDVMHPAVTFRDGLRWTDNENRIFREILDEYIDSNCTAPLSALKKVNKELKGTRTLQKIRLKFNNARKSRQRDKDARGKSDSEKQETSQTSVRKMVGKRHLKNLGYEIKRNMEYKSDQSSYEQNDIEDMVGEDETVKKRVRKRCRRKKWTHFKIKSKKAKSCTVTKTDLEKQTCESLTCHVVASDNMEGEVRLQHDKTLRNDSNSYDGIADLPSLSDSEGLTLGDDRTPLIEPVSFGESQLLNNSVMGNFENNDINEVASQDMQEKLLNDNANEDVKMPYNKEVKEKCRQEQTVQHDVNDYNEGIVQL
ncbi:uncharacterized protein LOC123555219 [Mercenaria mercenaria]|uniref:uncharacterized protein LOC123555219 n=1 Tax=Mercenaria mercenaria TaxID=6596 RepID=UPI00234E394A|nr:uncharacterized protein LOC123555219 [Mercenaria mercenaria]